MTAAQAAHYAAYQQQALAIAQAQQTMLAQSGYTSGTNPMWVSVPSGTTITTATTSTLGTLGNNVMNSLYSSQHLAAGTSALVRETLRLMGEVTIADGEPCKITLPDGSILDVAADGSFTIKDENAKVTYRANRVRDFNPFINASDKLEAFIRFCGEAGVKQDEMLSIPIRLFIGWLIIEAARADGENKDSDVDLLEGIQHYRKPRCVSCGRFIAPKLAARRVAFCRPVCLERELAA